MLRLFLLLLFSLPCYAINQGSQSGTRLQKSVIKIQFLWKMRPDMPCSGVIISSYTILTAAHCVDKIDLNKPIFMIHGKNKFKVESIFVPLEYYPAIKKYHNPPSGGNLIDIHRNIAQFDIAIINLRSELKGHYRPLKAYYKKMHSGVAVKTVGTGLVKNGSFYTSTDYAHERIEKLQVLPQGIYLTAGRNLDDPITSPGDSGGALLYQEDVIGIIRGTSFNKLEAASIYTPLIKHKNFIQRYSKPYIKRN